MHGDEETYFVSRADMLQQLESLAAHWTTVWQRHLQQRLLHAAPIVDFLSGYCPPVAAGGRPLLPY